jgi:spore coat polysaccharide biosynthesis protein SpsF
LIAVILQARLDSTRLPEKALLPLEGEPVIFRVMEALNHVEADLHILACSQDSFSAFEPIAKKAGFQIFAGPKEDVLERFCQVIRKYSITSVIRATGDNPFVFADAATALLSEASALNADYGGYINLPYGAGVEYIFSSALLQAASQTNAPYDREHVCPYLYNNPELFKLYRPTSPEKWHYPEIRLTIDTQEDYEHAKLLYSSLKKNEPHRYYGNTIIKKYLSLNTVNDGG